MWAAGSALSVTREAAALSSEVSPDEIDESMSPRRRFDGPSHRNRRKDRHGFTLAEVLAATVIVAILASVAIPIAQSRLTAARGVALGTELRNLGAGIRAFQKNVGKYPKNLVDLATSPSSGAADLCGTLLTPTEIAKWNGPYISRFITGDYIVPDNATIVNSMTWSSPYIRITITGLSPDVARAAEEEIDGPVVATSYSTGSFLYTSPDTVYRIALKAC
jgi:prepilin-type N-terminal cleavage/methylation domain-containing protein